MENEIVVKEKELLIEETKEIALEKIIAKVITIPGVKVEREKFLIEFLSKETEDIQKIIEQGPIVAGVSEEKLKKISSKLILERTAQSSFTSFAMGIPGGFAMAAAIPADIIQFYGILIKLVQELTYLYGAKDLWQDGKVEEETIRNQLLIYLGVMFGVSGATAGVRLLSAHLAKTALKKLPQKALTKTFWYPIIKSIGKSIGLKVTKKTLTTGVVKVVPVISGIVSGVLTFASMKPMAEKLVKVLNDSAFHYSEEELNNDIEIIDNLEEEKEEAVEATEVKKKSFFEKGKEKFSGVFKKKQKEVDDLDRIKKLKELLDMGAISQEEYDTKKKEILNL